MDVKLRVVQQIIYALVCIILYYQPSDNPFNQRQNAAGCIFFFLLVTAFGGIMANLSTFNMERPIFIR
jgi:hypothetical protein